MFLTQGIKESLIIESTQGDVGKISRGLEEVFILNSLLKYPQAKSFKGESPEMGHN